MINPRVILSFSFMAIVTITLCNCHNTVAPDIYSPTWSSTPVSITNDYISNRTVELHFSTDNKYLCCWCPTYENDGSPDKSTGYSNVYDMAGNVVKDATDNDGHLKGEYIDLFPRVSWRCLFSDFLKGSSGWGFSRDLKLGFRMIGPPIEVSAVNCKWTIELWQLRPTRIMVWSNSILLARSTPSAVLKIAEFINIDGKDYIVVSMGGKKGFLISLNDGVTSGEFTFGHIETDFELKELYKLYSNDTYKYDDYKDLRFSSYDLSVEPTRKLIACGSSSGRKLRVLSLTPPIKTVFESRMKDNAWEQWGGVWSTNETQFINKYLIIVTTCGARGIKHVLLQTEIYDIDSWKLIWAENARQVKSVTLSQDGNWIAFVRGNTIEMGEFNKCLSMQE